MSRANPTVTSANAIYLLAVEDLFSPVQLQQFAADAAFDTEAVVPAEVEMGVDGHLSAGLVRVSIKQKITLPADSSSVQFFEQWNAAQQAANDIYFASGTIKLLSTGRTYTLTRGVLTSFKPLPDAKKVLGHMEYEITWESITGGDA